jgi:hypothetical protein
MGLTGIWGPISERCFFIVTQTAFQHPGTMLNLYYEFPWKGVIKINERFTEFLP